PEPVLSDGDLLFLAGADHLEIRCEQQPGCQCDIVKRLESPLTAEERGGDQRTLQGRVVDVHVVVGNAEAVVGAALEEALTAEAEAEEVLQEVGIAVAGAEAREQTGALSRALLRLVQILVEVV